MSSKNKLLIGYKTFFGFLALSSVGLEIYTLVDRNIFNPVNFFSYFTILSNVFAAIMLLVAAYFIVHRNDRSKLDLLRGTATLYMVTTGLVFSVLLAGIENSVLTAVPWDNIVLHYIMPVVLLLDWIVDPPAKIIPFKKTLLWLVFPLTYVAYSLIRGHITDWYPYPFLNPAKDGYSQVAITSIGIAVVVLVISWGLLKIHSRSTSAKA